MKNEGINDPVNSLSSTWFNNILPVNKINVLNKLIAIDKLKKITANL